MKQTLKEEKKNSYLNVVVSEAEKRKKQIHQVCQLKKPRKEKEKKREDIPECGVEEKELKREEKRKKERDVDVFYIRGRRRRRRRRRRGSSVVK